MNTLLLDPSTPWLEDPEVLKERTVGRGRELDWLNGSCRKYLEGGNPPYALLVGPRGFGKSHLIHVVRGALPPDACVWLGEDIPPLQDADELWARMAGEFEAPWSWDKRQDLAKRRILFVEGIDRKMDALDEAGRWTIRHRLQESGYYLVATSFVTGWASGPEAAFYGQFSTRLLRPLTFDDSLGLFCAVSGSSDSDHSRVRAHALARLAGGSPRTVMAFAQVAALAQTADAADVMMAGVSRLVGHFQQRFYELPPLGQRMVEMLARSPRALRASELSDGLATTSAAISGAAKVLEEKGVLERVRSARDGRVALYKLAEPMLRFWLEYRRGRGGRAELVTRMLENALTSEELEDVWWTSADTELRRELARAVEDPMDVWLRQLSTCTNVEGARSVARRAAQEPIDKFWGIGFWVLLANGWQDAVIELAPWIGSDAEFDALYSFRMNLQDSPENTSEHLAELLSVVSSVRNERTLYVALEASVDWLLRAHAPPKVTFTQKTLEDLASVPVLRARYAVAGVRDADRPLLAWSRLCQLAGQPNLLDDAHLMNAAHLHRDTNAFQAFAAKSGGLLHNPRPEWPAPAPDALVPLMALWPGMAQSWAASLATMSEQAFLDAVPFMQTQGVIGRDLGVTAMLVLLGLQPERFERVAARWTNDPVMLDARRLHAQLAESERGPLHPELEFVRAALAREPIEP